MAQPTEQEKCWLCLENHVYNDLHANSWVRFCSCCMWAHEECLLRYYASSPHTACCPTCRTKLRVTTGHSSLLRWREAIETTLKITFLGSASVTVFQAVVASTLATVWDIGANTIELMCDSNQAKFLLGGPRNNPYRFEAATFPFSSLSQLGSTSASTDTAILRPLSLLYATKLPSLQEYITSLRRSLLAPSLTFYMGTVALFPNIGRAIPLMSLLPLILTPLTPTSIQLAKSVTLHSVLSQVYGLGMEKVYAKVIAMALDLPGKADNTVTESDGESDGYSEDSEIRGLYRRRRLSFASLELLAALNSPGLYNPSEQIPAVIKDAVEGASRLFALFLIKRHHTRPRSSTRDPTRIIIDIEPILQEILRNSSLLGRRKYLWCVRVVSTLGSPHIQSLVATAVLGLYDPECNIEQMIEDQMLFEPIESVERYLHELDPNNERFAAVLHYLAQIQMFRNELDGTDESEISDDSFDGLEQDSSQQSDIEPRNSEAMPLIGYKRTRSFVLRIAYGLMTPYASWAIAKGLELIPYFARRTKLTRSLCALWILYLWRDLVDIYSNLVEVHQSNRQHVLRLNERSTETGTPSLAFQTLQNLQLRLSRFMRIRIA